MYYENIDLFFVSFIKIPAILEFLVHLRCKAPGLFHRDLHLSGMTSSFGRSQVFWYVVGKYENFNLPVWKAISTWFNLVTLLIWTRWECPMSFCK